MKKRWIAALVLLLAMLMLLAGCSNHGKTVMTAGNNQISINVYQLYLSRMKGALASAGYAVNDSTFWNTYVGLEDNKTHGEYYSDQVFNGLRQIAAALILYDELGLRLPASDEASIDAWIDKLIKEVGGGSQNQLNSVLSAYGANITVLRDAAIIEAKINQLKTHLYGENGALLGDNVKEQYYQNTYYRGRHMLIAGYYHDHEKDSDGYARYYKVNKDGNLLNAIAYDTVNGTATSVTDKNGDTVYRKLGDILYDKTNGTIAYDNVGGQQVKRRDDAGNVIYLTKDNKIAYDTTKGRATEEIDENGDTVYREWIVAYDTKDGKPKYYYESDGSNKVAYYNTEEMEKRYLLAQQIAENCKGNEALFMEYVSEYSDDLYWTQTYAPNGVYFSAGIYTSDPFFQIFSTELAKIEVGELSVIPEEDVGYYVLMRTELDSGAWAEETNKRWFETLNGYVVEYMLQKRTEDYVALVQVDEELRRSVDITMIAANNYY